MPPKEIHIYSVYAITKNGEKVIINPSDFANITTIDELEERMDEIGFVCVVRCRDCKYHSHDAGYGRDWCNRTSGVFRVEPHDFCSKAVKKE